MLIFQKSVENTAKWSEENAVSYIIGTGKSPIGPRAFEGDVCHINRFRPIHGGAKSDPGNDAQVRLRTTMEYTNRPKFLRKIRSVKLQFDLSSGLCCQAEA
jgi:hypothetical protein